MSSLQKHLNTALHVAQLGNTLRDKASISRLRPFTARLQELLGDKLAQLTQRRYQLKASGKWTRDAQLKCFAERLAFETLLSSQVAQALQSVHRSDCHEASLKLQDLVETHRKLSFLEKKLTNPDFDMDTMTPLEFYTSLLTEKLVVQGEIQDGFIESSSTPLSKNIPLNDTCKDLQQKLLERERNLASLVTHYKEEKLYEIAVVMARETISGQQPPCDESVLLEELRMREAWVIAQDLVTQELLNLEASQSLLRMSQLLNPNTDGDTVLTYPTAMNLDKLHTAAEESLRQEMEESVMTLSNKYEDILARYRSGDTGIVNSMTTEMDVVLGEFAAVIAQKATIDGHLAVVQGEAEGSSSEPLAIVEETRDSVGLAGDVAASEAHLLMFLGGGDPALESFVRPALTQAEFLFLYNKATEECKGEVSDLVFSISNQESSRCQSLRSSSSSILNRDQESESLQSLVSSVKVPPSPKAKRKSERKSRRASDITGMTDGCKQCEELRQEIAKLKRSVEFRRTRDKEVECKKCPEFISKLKVRFNFLKPHFLNH